ncbi:AsnC family transcriptional regulator [Tianweitania sp. Rool2]|uniref:AsnC family transcriptional regulator n=1 Tax=Oryzicola mucosus TaxID=2767425 RepID=A0A8J6U0G2_9HYPH|nr:AsnC family transcriptional regulator [Oryzicola mucosus]
MERYLMTGHADYLLRVVVTNVVALQNFSWAKSPSLRCRKHPVKFALKQVKYRRLSDCRTVWCHLGAGSSASE